MTNLVLNLIEAARMYADKPAIRLDDDVHSYAALDEASGGLRGCCGPAMRHMADMESIHTYEGTETIQTLIVGKDITGVGAFA